MWQGDCNMRSSERSRSSQQRFVAIRPVSMTDRSVAVPHGVRLSAPRESMIFSLHKRTDLVVIVMAALLPPGTPCLVSLRGAITCTLNVAGQWQSGNPYVTSNNRHFKPAELIGSVSLTKVIGTISISYTIYILPIFCCITQKDSDHQQKMIRNLRPLASRLSPRHVASSSTPFRAAAAGSIRSLATPTIEGRSSPLHAHSVEEYVHFKAKGVGE